MAVAGPERSGSGRGVPVPSITICVPSARRARLLLWLTASIGPDVGGLDHRLPPFGSSLEQRAGLGTVIATGSAPGREAAPADRGTARCFYLAFESGADGFRDPRGRQHHEIESDIEPRITALRDRRDIRGRCKARGEGWKPRAPSAGPSRTFCRTPGVARKPAWICPPTKPITTSALPFRDVDSFKTSLYGKIPSSDGRDRRGRRRCHRSAAGP